MKYWPSYNHVRELIPFTMKGCRGLVAVYYGANNDPRMVGFDSLPGIGFDLGLSRGYPVIHAHFENFDGTGYRMFCGWIQIVTSVYQDAHDQGAARTETFINADIAPAFEPTRIPCAAYGYLPQLFNAPGLSLGKAAALR